MPRRLESESIVPRMRVRAPVALVDPRVAAQVVHRLEDALSVLDLAAWPAAAPEGSLENLAD